MANIGTATVESIHIPDGAVSEYKTGSISTDSSRFGGEDQDVTISNSAGTPVEIWLDGEFEVESNSGASVQGSCEVTLTQKGGSSALFSTSLDHSTKGSYSTPINGQMLDLNAGVNQTYTIHVEASKTGGTLSSDKATVSCSITLIAAKK